MRLFLLCTLELIPSFPALPAGPWDHPQSPFSCQGLIQCQVVQLPLCAGRVWEAGDRELQVPVGWVLYLTHHVIYHLSLTWGCRWRTTPPSIQVCPLLVVTLVVLMSKLFILSIAQFAWVTNKKTTTTIYLGEGGGFENLVNWVCRTLINMMF